MRPVLFSLLLNISLLALVASLLTKTRLVRHILLDQWENPYGQITLAVLFGLTSILSTYTGVDYGGMLVNTRVISVLAGGLIGGPVVGIGAGLIAGVHRYLFVAGFTRIPCSISTVLAGFIGSFFYPRFQRGKWDNRWIFLITAFTEILHMGIILLCARPFETALQVVRSVALPMVLLNSCGMLLFFSIFNHVFIERDQESANKQRLALWVAQQCLPHLRKGLHSKADVEAAVHIILDSDCCLGVLITDLHNILSQAQRSEALGLELLHGLPSPAQKAMETRGAVTVSSVPEDDPLAPLMRRHIAIAAPLLMKGQPIGSLMILVRRQWLTLEADLAFVEGLAPLFSTQLELSELDFQKSLRRKAELKALQTQINPHFLFNALNTISYVCRKDSARARDLLLLLSNYFRQTLEENRSMISLEEEIDQVNNYLLLEKERFEDKLKVNISIPPGVTCQLPPYTLQPIVENAVKHGADENGHRDISIFAQDEGTLVRVAVCDHGQGFPTQILEDLKNDSIQDHHFGLTNVNKRLKSIYGEQFGLQINCSSEGSCVELLLSKTPVYV